jgi:hypothetical protein
VTNTLHDVLVQAESWLDQEDDLLDMVKRWSIAFSRSMMVHLREDGDLEAELKVRLQNPRNKTLDLVAPARGRRPGGRAEGRRPSNQAGKA